MIGKHFFISIVIIIIILLHIVIGIVIIIITLLYYYYSGATEEEVQLKKIITDVDTRWNSTLFFIRSIFEMKPVLQSLMEGRFEDQDKTDKNLKQKIPSAQTFDIIEAIIPIMEKVLLLSEMLSGDEKPTLHLVIPMIYNLDCFLYAKMRAASQTSWTRDYCKAMSTELNRR